MYLESVQLFTLALVALAAASWGDASQSQYHIQTDEGPERYFRFQTDNGQFRKEKRLQDGTVIGTEAWIDAAGFLRQKDYIADKQGYRILKSKTIFVGQNRGIEEAIKSTKAAPAQSGVLVDGNVGGNSVAGGYRKHGYGYSSTTTTTTPPPALYSSPYLATANLDSGVGKLNYLPPEQAAKIEPQTQLGFDHYPDELPRARDHLLGGNVHIQPNAEPIDEINAINVYDEEANHGFAPGRFAAVIASTTPRPAVSSPAFFAPELSMLPPLSAHRRRVRPRPTAVDIVSTTPAPIAAHDQFAYSTPAPFVVPPSVGDAGYHYAPTATPPRSSYGLYTSNLPLDVNALDSPLLPPLPDRAYRRRLRPLHSNNLDASDYDGVSVTRNGFRYVLPKQYHEEAQVDGKRAGSYGYVDPFGIRRVVYYNAAPGRGFVHRNNNQYVGANGAPYDDPGPAQLVNE
ncbi:uncharacterized protein LOC6583479 [Drosophila mojavensis]|uniref:Uncharacterized protein n=1 Tax=Drosophila mojavensis TaxID=7230 RepID=B4KWJ4_DROMO|nr:uncharacterized protein LOC6583479 [Drosophila mojavensis]EDW19623.2 uncharacterized protein Dmoj_GI13886 [Drosophila mojavensis]